MSISWRINQLKGPHFTYISELHKMFVIKHFNMQNKNITNFSGQGQDSEAAQAPTRKEQKWPNSTIPGPRQIIHPADN